MKLGIKSKFLISSSSLLSISVAVLILIVYFNFRAYSIEENVDKARKTAKQLVAMRGYMATIAPWVEFKKESINRWAATPAYSGAQVAKKVSKEANFYIKQTALKYRNKLNIPNETEKKMINLITLEDKEEFWEIGPHEGSDSIPAGTKSILYAYRLTVKKACLKCHGVRGKDVPEALYEKLVADYGETAFDFEEGDVRGIVSVAIPLSLATDATNTTLIKIGVIGLLITVIISVIFYITARITTSSIDKVSHRLKDISVGEGDLTAKLVIDTQDEIGDLAHDFNTFVEKLRVIIRDVKDTSVELASAMEEQSATTIHVAESAQALVEEQTEITRASNKNTEHVESVAFNVDVQANCFVTLTNRVDELSDTISKVSEESKQAMNMAKGITAKIQLSEEALTTTNTSMQKIEKSSIEMTGIMSLINDIADQINLLSLNAAIESARAGEAGRGFAVVADQISKLADETGTSIKNIDSLIHHNEDEIKKGIESVKNTVEHINAIIGDATSISTTINKMFDFMQLQITYNASVHNESETVLMLAKEINEAIEEHQTSTVMIESSINKINQFSQDNAASAEEMSATAEEISGMAESLRLLVDVFKV
ncbi:MAG: methyl-accepting chemotaxis protein [bacterium]|nr:methyl-accepting chemotaxis protein [bacterium]